MHLPDLSEPVPHSAGRSRPSRVLPALACDSHMHIFDRRFSPPPPWPRPPPGAPVAAAPPRQRRPGAPTAAVGSPCTYSI